MKLSVLEASLRTPKKKSKPVLQKAIRRSNLVLNEMANDIPVIISVKYFVLTAPDKAAFEAVKARKGSLRRRMLQVVK